MADPVNPQIVNPNFTLNLDTNMGVNSNITNEEKTTSETNNDRLQKEDKLVEEHIKPIETTISNIPTEIEENRNEEVNAPPTEIQQVAKSTTDLEKDLQIIQNLEKKQEVNGEENKEITSKGLSSNSLNLDNISTKLPKAEEKIPIGDIPTAPNIPLNPYDHLQNYIPQISLTGTNNVIEKRKSGAIGLAIGIGFLLLAWFVVKTMYPIQYKDVIGSLLGNNEGGINTNIIESITENTGEILDITGNKIVEGDEFGSGKDFLDGGLLDSGVLEGINGSGENLSGNIHNGADEEKPLLIQQGIDTKEKFKETLENYKTQGKNGLDEAKINENKEQLKYSLAVYRKAEGYLQDIANGKEMTTIEMKNIISELSGYLNKFIPADANISTEKYEKPPIPKETGTTEFNPDAFFGNTEN